MELGDLFASMFLKLVLERSPKQLKCYVHGVVRVLAGIHHDDLHVAGPGQSSEELMRGDDAHIG